MRTYKKHKKCVTDRKGSKFIQRHKVFWNIKNLFHICPLIPPIIPAFLLLWPNNRQIVWIFKIKILLLHHGKSVTENM
jgi:hypothetical protein